MNASPQRRSDATGAGYADRGFVKRTLIVAAVLVALYALIVPRVVPKWNSWQSQQQTNTILAQRYLYDDRPYATVIVGSSLSNRLTRDSLPASVANLGFGGLSITDGLHIIERRGYAPPVVAIEMNVAFKKPDQNFHTSVLSPAFYWMRKYVAATRDEYQPIGLMKGWASARSEAKKKAFGKVPLAVAEHDAIHEKMVAMQREQRDQAPDTAALNEVMQAVKRLTDALEAQGTRIVLFEMPVHPDLVNMAEPRAIREAFTARYPAGRYTYIPSPDPVDFNTTDGLHLDEESAARYTAYLRDALQDIR